MWGSLLQSINAYNNIEMPKLNWHLGVNINKKVGSRWYVKSGLRLASMGYKDKKVSGLTWPSQHNGNGGFDPNATPGILEYQLSRDFWYLEIPLMCRYQFGNKKLHAFVEAGFSPSIFLTMRNVTVKNGKKTVDYRQDFSTSSIDSPRVASLKIVAPIGIKDFIM